MGVIFHYLYKGPAFFSSIRNKVRSHPVMAFLLAIFLVEFSVDKVYPPGILHFLMPVLFLVMIYKKKYLSFLDNRLFRRIGVISYSVYLIHEVTGVLLIYKYGGMLGGWSFLAPFIMIALVILFAELSFRFYEKKTARFLKAILKAP